ncbi:MAG: NAD(P)-dependent oxidoreductase [Alcaligenaceae bacterium]|nr:MAG: NAD(P)-dependent oxidoreductase [Alcaligenaceae bacterium]
MTNRALQTDSYGTPLATPSTKRVLIAGCGDLGLRVARLLALESAFNQSWGLRRNPSLESTNDLQSFSWIAADLTQPDTLRDLPEHLTHVLYTAAPNARTEADYRAVYRDGLKRLLQTVASPALQRVLFVSSTAVYGDHGAQWIDEDTPTAPKSFNGRVLLETEQWLHSQSAQFETLSLRLSGIYGPGRSYLLDRLRTGRATAPAAESHWVNRIHIEDAAAAVLHLLNLPNPQPVYLVTDSTPLPMRVLYDALAKLVGGPVPPVGLAPASVGSKRLSNARLSSSGFTFKWPDSREGHAALISK